MVPADPHVTHTVFVRDDGDGYVRLCRNQFTIVRLSFGEALSSPITRDPSPPSLSLHIISQQSGYRFGSFARTQQQVKVRVRPG